MNKTMNVRIGRATGNASPLDQTSIAGAFNVQMEKTFAEKIAIVRSDNAMSADAFSDLEALGTTVVKVLSDAALALDGRMLCRGIKRLGSNECVEFV